MNKERILITGSVMNSDEELVNTYKSLISMIDIKNYQISTPLDTMMFKGNWLWKIWKGNDTFKRY